MYFLVYGKYRLWNLVVANDLAAVFFKGFNGKKSSFLKWVESLLFMPSPVHSLYGSKADAQNFASTRAYCYINPNVDTLCLWFWLWSSFWYLLKSESSISNVKMVVTLTVVRNRILTNRRLALNRAAMGDHFHIASRCLHSCGLTCLENTTWKED